MAPDTEDAPGPTRDAAHAPPRGACQLAMRSTRKAAARKTAARKTVKKAAKKPAAKKTPIKRKAAPKRSRARQPQVRTLIRMDSDSGLGPVGDDESDG